MANTPFFSPLGMVFTKGASSSFSFSFFAFFSPPAGAVAEVFAAFAAFAALRASFSFCLANFFSASNSACL